MKKILNITNYFLDFFVFFYDVFLFKIRKKNSRRSYNSFLRYFFLTGGISNDIINFFVSKPPKHTSLKKGLLSKYDNQSIAKYLEKLKFDGYIILENILTSSDVGQLIKEFEKKSGFYISDKNGVSDKQKLDINNPSEVKFFYKSQDIIDEKNFHKILFDPSFINFSQQYLKSYPIIDNVSSWWSFPTTEPDKNAAQLWHFDLDRPKWLKFFFFMTDCTIETGAHSFVRGSHKNNGIKWNLRKKGYTRILDEEVNNHYDKKDIIQMQAKKGSLLIEDTRGLHKGSRLIKDHRFLIQVQYSSSTFGTKIEKFNFPKTENNDYIDIKNQFKHTYSLFS